MVADQVGKFLESPLVALFITLLLGALAASGRVSGLAANLCLLLAWGVGSNGIMRSGLPDFRLKGASICVLAGICLLISYWISPSQEAKPVINVGVRSAMIYDGPGDLSLYMVGYESLYGATASPVFYLVNISIVNSSTAPVTVEGYSVAVGDTERGPWEDLVPISLLSSNLYALGVKTTGSGAIAVPRGAYRLASPMKPEDMAHAALIDPLPKLESELRGRPLEPYQTVGGWAAFDLKDHANRGVRNYFRITVRDSTGQSFSATVRTPRRQPGDSESDAQIGTINKVGAIVDMREFHVRYYGAPYPKPTQR